MKIIAAKDKKDRWDQLDLEKTVHKQHQHDGFSENGEFAFFDEGEDQVFMNDEKLVVVSDNRQHLSREDDMLKQIFEKEFVASNNYHVAPKPIQKPPRKSLESLNSKKTTSNCSSRNSMRFDD